MRYKGKVYRPPSEAYSLIVQVTYGCSHNRCAFCDMYDDKHFAMRPMEEIFEDFRMARQLYRHVERVFLADGDALMRRTADLVQILDLIYGLFPECERVTSYASPGSLHAKSEEDLRLLRQKGLTMLYMGLESGCDAVLERMTKGHTAAAIVAAGQKARRCGFALSVTARKRMRKEPWWTYSAQRFRFLRQRVYSCWQRPLLRLHGLPWRFQLRNPGNYLPRFPWFPRSESAHPKVRLCPDRAGIHSHRTDSGICLLHQQRSSSALHC